MERPVYCVSADGRPYMIPAASILTASGPPAHTVRDRRGRIHRLAVGGMRRKLGLPKLTLHEFEVVWPKSIATAQLVPAKPAWV